MAADRLSENALYLKIVKTVILVCIPNTKISAKQDTLYPYCDDKIPYTREKKTGDTRNALTVYMEKHHINFLLLLLLIIIIRLLGSNSLKESLGVF